MKNSNIIFLLVCIFFISLGSACSSSTTTEPDKEDVTTQISPLDYVGKYDVEGTRDRILIDIYQEGDSLYLYSIDKGASALQMQKKEIYDVPRHESKLRFMRNEKGEVDRVIMLTPKGRYIAAKMHPDSAKVVVDTLAIKYKEHHRKLDSLKAIFQE